MMRHSIILRIRITDDRMTDDKFGDVASVAPVLRRESVICNLSFVIARCL